MHCNLLFLGKSVSLPEVRLLPAVHCIKVGEDSISPIKYLDIDNVEDLLIPSIKFIKY